MAPIRGSDRNILRISSVWRASSISTTSRASATCSNGLAEERQLVNDKTTQPDWTDLLAETTIAAMATAASPLLDAETFSASSQRDALNRVLVAIFPDDSEVLCTYDEGGALQKVEVKHRGSETAETVVGDITYNARGQREAVVYARPRETRHYTELLEFGKHRVALHRPAVVGVKHQLILGDLLLDTARFDQLGCQRRVLDLVDHSPDNHSVPHVEHDVEFEEATTHFGWQERDVPRPHLIRADRHDFARPSARWGPSTTPRSQELQGPGDSAMTLPGEN